MNHINTIYDELLWRGLVHQSTPEEPLKSVLQGSVTLYAGFDSTADSLHVGNLLLIFALKRFQLFGHRPVVLVGGGTGLIGDPSGKSSERNMNEASIVAGWSKKIIDQLRPFLNFDSGDNKAVMVNNYDWLSKLNMIDYLRGVGKNFSVNEMISRDSIKTRLEREGPGISYTEFSYMILQAYDFLELFKTRRCLLQIGGSDQWGNIVSGIELIRRVEGEEAFALTLPLITSASGKKLGKTESGAVWLDKNKTSPFTFYQFWLNTDDRDVINYLRFFTFLVKEEIEEIEKQHLESPEKRSAQRTLARQVTSLVHGEEGLLEAERATAFFFGEDAKMDTASLVKTFDLMPADTVISFEALVPLEDMLVISGLCDSKSDVRRSVQEGGIYLNNQRVQVQQSRSTVSMDDLIKGKFVLLRRGKKSFKLCRLLTN